ncbi:MAG: hypothetical protein BZ137_00555 [Methanosphaera sp. rholeuAM130]|nr:MAG: hypothetical protein BZ137_00555 [Methanosphaera sp. rholeuAM130]
MNHKHAFVIFITALLLIVFTLTVVYNNAGVDVVNPQIITHTVNNDTSYQLNYSLAAGGNFEVLDCESAFYTSENQFMGKSSTVLENVTIGGIPINENITMEENTQNLTPKKVKISIFKQKLTPEQKLENGTYAVDAFYEKTFDLQ